MNYNETNRVIAEFMNRYNGLLIEDCEDPITVSVKSRKWGDDGIETRPFTYADLQYHASWDWLMPVIEKIEADGAFRVEIIQERCNIGMLDYSKPFWGKGDFNASTKLEATYNAVIQFINYYNK